MSDLRPQDILCHDPECRLGEVIDKLEAKLAAAEERIKEMESCLHRMVGGLEPERNGDGYVWKSPRRSGEAYPWEFGCTFENIKRARVLLGLEEGI